MSETHDIRALAIIPKSFDESVEMAKQLAKSQLLPKAMIGKEADVLVTIMAGQEMGLAPMASLRGFNVQDGKPQLYADTMVALVLGSGKAEYFDRVEESDTAVTYETKRVGSSRIRRCTWTKQRVKDAGLNTKDNHRLYSIQMLAARAKSELARDVYPDVLAGCYSVEEMSGYEPNEQDRPRSGDVIEADFVEKPADEEPTPHEILALDHTENEAQAKEMGPVLAKLPKKWHALANEKYKARLKFHREQPVEAKTEAAS